MDLVRNELALRLNPGKVSDVTFEARNTVLSIELAEGATLMSLDRELMERFARWLTARVLTKPERCGYGVGGDECPKEVVAP